MSEEIQVGERDMGWRKAIPEARDRRQSKWLVGVVGTVLALETTSVHPQIYFLLATDRAAGLILIAKMVGISLAFVCLVSVLRAATLGGALAGGMICMILLNGTVSLRETMMRSGLTPLVLLFVLTFLSTRAGRREKIRTGLAEDRRGRSAAQVIANLAAAALSVSWLTLVFLMGVKISPKQYYLTWVHPVMMIMCLAALVEATADTVSSEIGQAFGGVPVMIVGLQRAEAGADGAVTLLGSGAGVIAGVLVAAVGAWALRLSVMDGAIAAVAGVCGLFFDSLLGATVERRGWVGNDLVNFTSTVFAALLAATVYRLLMH